MDANGSNARKRKHPSFAEMGTHMQEFLVGPKEQSFKVHVDLLKYYSNFFGGFYGPGDLQAPPLTYPLPDTTPRTFAVFMDWIYQRRLVRPASSYRQYEAHKRRVSAEPVDEHAGQEEDQLKSSNSQNAEYKNKKSGKARRKNKPCISAIVKQAAKDAPWITVGDCDPNTLKVNDSGFVHYMHMIHGWDENDLLLLYILAFKFGIKDLARDVVALWQESDDKFLQHASPKSVNLLCREARQSNLFGLFLSSWVKYCDHDGDRVVWDAWDHLDRHFLASLTREMVHKVRSSCGGS